MPLEYPVTKEYTIPHLTTYFSVFSIVAIVGLAVLNVVLQGYDIVTVLRPNPNVTESYWWSTSALSFRSAGDCNPVSLGQKSIISTNSSLFSYELRSTFDASGRNIAGASSYMANPLRSCTVDGIIANLDINRQTYDFEIPILCTGPDLPFSLSLLSTFSLNTANPYNDDIISHYIQNKPSREGLNTDQPLIKRNASSLLNIIGVLDAVSTDLQLALRSAIRTPENAPSIITTGGLLTCPGGQNATCLPEDRKMTIPECAITYPNGTFVYSEGIGALLAPIEANFINMFTVLQDAYHIDFGNIQPSNTLLSTQAFSSRIKSSAVVSEFVQKNQVTVCTWGLGCLKGSTWVDKLLASDPGIDATIPSIVPTGNTSAVVKVDYLCPEFRIKRPGSLITSVFIGTWSMYTALVGLFRIIGPVLEKRYGHARTAGDAYDATPEYELKS